MATGETFKIVVLPGDHAGVEVTEEAVGVLRVIQDCTPDAFELDYQLIGGAAIDATGDPLPEATLTAIRASQAVLLGAVGGPKWGHGSVRPEQGLLKLRKSLGLFANVRPVMLPAACLLDCSPLRPEVVRGTDMVFVRELTGGIYFGKRQEEADGAAYDTMEYTVAEIERVTRIAAGLARKRRGKVTQVDKANVLATSRMWRRVSQKIIETEFPDVTLEHLYVDAASMHLIRKPAEFDVVLCENLFGDILTDEASMLPGSLGLLPSASLSETTLGVYEPIHGSAPDIAGKNIANPIAAILSVAMMMRYSLGREAYAAAIEKAVELALESGVRTGDIAQAGAPAVGTKEMGAAIQAELRKLLKA